MSQQYITYEHPLTEQFRSFLRIIDVAKHLEHNLSLANSWDSKACLQTLIELYRLLDTTVNTKQICDVIAAKKSYFSNLLDTPKVNVTAVNQLIDQLELSLEKCQQMPVQLKDLIEDDLFIQHIKSRIFLVNGACAFDLPDLHLWLNLPLSHRQEYIQKYFEQIEPMLDAIKLLLNLTRNFAHTKCKTTQNGKYSFELNKESRYKLITISILAEYKVFPQISANEQSVKINFMKFDSNNNPFIYKEKLDFDLCCCVF